MVPRDRIRARDVAGIAALTRDAVAAADGVRPRAQTT
jgi:hypothetical protein